MPRPTDHREASDSSTKPRKGRKSRLEDKLDGGLEETFPASDPVSLTHTTHAGRGKTS